MAKRKRKTASVQAQVNRIKEHFIAEQKQNIILEYCKRELRKTHTNTLDDLSRAVRQLF